MSLLRTSTGLAAALALALLPAPPAAAQGSSSDAGAAAGGARTAPSRERPQERTQTRPQSQPAAKRKVWTNADLVALRSDPSAQVLVLESKRVGNTPPVTTRKELAVQPQDVVDRYDEMAREAQAKIGELQRELLAGSNPFLRGLASKTGGPRPREEVQADLERWNSRLESARSNRDRARRLTGAEPTAPGEQR